MCKWFVITIMKSFLLLVDILTPNHLNSGVHLLYVIVFSSLRLGFFFWGSYYVSVRSFTAHLVVTINLVWKLFKRPFCTTT